MTRVPALGGRPSRVRRIRLHGAAQGRTPGMIRLKTTGGGSRDHRGSPERDAAAEPRQADRLRGPMCTDGARAGLAASRPFLSGPVCADTGARQLLRPAQRRAREAEQ